MNRPHESLATKLARFAYGKSDSANAKENQTDGFQRGYKFAIDHPSMGSCEMIAAEFLRQGRPMVATADFTDWKRGMWAAVFQRLESQIKQAP